MVPHGMNICKKKPPKLLSSTFTPPLSPRLPCFLRSAWSRSRPLPTGARGHRGRRRPLESEPRRVEDLELSEVLQPVDLEARIRAAGGAARGGGAGWPWLGGPASGRGLRGCARGGARRGRWSCGRQRGRTAAGPRTCPKVATRPAELRAAPRHDRRPVGLSRGGRRRVPWSRSSVSRPPCGPALPPPPSQRPPRSSLGAAAVRRWEPPRQPTPAHAAQGARPPRGGWPRPGARRSGLAPCAGGGARGSSGGELLQG